MFYELMKLQIKFYLNYTKRKLWRKNNEQLITQSATQSVKNSGDLAIAWVCVAARGNNK